MREAIGVSQDDEACVAQTFPLILELWAVGPEKFEDLVLKSASVSMQLGETGRTDISDLQLGGWANLVALASWIPGKCQRGRDTTKSTKSTESAHSPRGCREDEDDLSVVSSPYPESLPATVREYSLFPISFETVRESRRSKKKSLGRGGEEEPRSNTTPGSGPSCLPSDLD